MRDDIVVVEIEAGDGDVRSRPCRLFLDRQSASVAIELDHAVLLRCVDRHSRIWWRRARAPSARANNSGSPWPWKILSPRTSATRSPPMNSAPMMNASARPRGVVLAEIGEAQSEIGAVAEQALEQGLVRRRRYDQDVADAGEHQRRQRVVDHRLVEDRQKLLRHDGRDRIKPRARAAGKDDSLHRLPVRRAWTGTRSELCGSASSFWRRTWCFVYSRRSLSARRICRPAWHRMGKGPAATSPGGDAVGRAEAVVQEAADAAETGRSPLVTARLGACLRSRLAEGRRAAGAAGAASGERREERGRAGAVAELRAEKRFMTTFHLTPH